MKRGRVIKLGRNETVEVEVKTEDAKIKFGITAHIRHLALFSPSVNGVTVPFTTLSSKWKEIEHFVEIKRKEEDE